MAIALAIVTLASACGESEPEADAFTPIAVRDFDSQPAELRHTDGRPLVINFFAESCAPCVAEMPAFDAVHRALGDTVDFVGLSEDATAAAGQRIIAATGISYPTLWDADGSALSRFQAIGLPTTVFVTATGEVVDVHTGVLTEETLTAKVDELVDRG